MVKRTTTKIVIAEATTAAEIRQFLVQVQMPTGERETVQVGDYTEREAIGQALDLWGHRQPDLSRYKIVKPSFF